MKMSAKVRSRREKESRWEMIRKKHINCINVKSETVRRFLKMDIKVSSEDKAKVHLNPVLVMDMRHEMVSKWTRIYKQMITFNKNHSDQAQTKGRDPSLTDPNHIGPIARRYGNKEEI